MIGFIGKYRTKKLLIKSIGQPLRLKKRADSCFIDLMNNTITVQNPHRNWKARVTIKQGIVTKVV